MTAARWTEAKSPRSINALHAARRQRRGRDGAVDAAAQHQHVETLLGEPQDVVSRSLR